MSARELWDGPTLGLQVADWLEGNLVHGPGDLAGEPYRLTDEMVAFLCRAYSVHPRGHAREGRRVVTTGLYSRPKGAAKSELAAAVAVAEASPDAPVRCDGFDARGEPVGRPVRSPVVLIAAASMDQSEETAYASVLTMVGDGPLSSSWDVGLERCRPLTGDGVVKPVASAAGSRDGARTTFQVLEEVHLWRPGTGGNGRGGLVELANTMLRNAAKRREAEPWTLMVSTAHLPGEGSVCEQFHEVGNRVLTGELEDPSILLDHLQADPIDIRTASDRDLRRAIRQARGDAKWIDVERVLTLLRDPRTDPADGARYFLNAKVSPASKWCPADAFDAVARSDYTVEAGAGIVVGFDGSQSRDATAIVAMEVATGHAWLAGLWERPHTVGAWEVPRGEVLAAMADLHDLYDVRRAYCDPYWWRSELAEMHATHGTIREWPTNRRRPMSDALDAAVEDVRTGAVTHNGDPRLRRHVLAAERVRDGAYVRLAKPRETEHIDAAVAFVLASEARRDQVRSGADTARSNADPALLVFSFD